MPARSASLRRCGVLAALLVLALPGCATSLRTACGPATAGPEPTPAPLETLDRFRFEDGRPTMAGRVVVDRWGNCFYACSVGADVYTHWLVRRSTDDGRTWTNADGFDSGAGRWNYPTGIAAGDDGTLLVSGVAEDANGVFAHVQRSTDRGATWSTAAHHRRPGASSCKAYNVRILGRGLAFTTGRCADGGIHWLLRRSTDGGATWADVDFPHATQPYASKVFDVVRAANGDLVAFGYLDSPTKEAWLFRRSGDDGRTWTDLARVHTQDGFTDVVGGLTATAGGALVAAGWTIDPKGPIRGLLRRSTDNGATWRTVDDYEIDASRTLYQGVAEDARGRLFALATQASPRPAGAGPTRGMIRASVDGGATWRDFRELAAPDGTDATYTSLCIDAADRLYVSGRHGDFAVVLRLPLAGPRFCPGACRPRVRSDAPHARRETGRSVDRDVDRAAVFHRGIVFDTE